MAMRCFKICCNNSRMNRLVCLLFLICVTIVSSVVVRRDGVGAMVNECKTSNEIADIVLNNSQPEDFLTYPYEFYYLDARNIRDDIFAQERCALLLDNTCIHSIYLPRVEDFELKVECEAYLRRHDRLGNF